MLHADKLKNIYFAEYPFLYWLKELLYVRNSLRFVQQISNRDNTLFNSVFKESIDNGSNIYKYTINLICKSFNLIKYQWNI